MPRLEMYEPQSAKGGSATGSSLGKITFQFNPKEVTISKSAKWERQPAKGAKKAGPPEYKGADPCKMTVEMFFDAALKSDLSVVDAVEKLFSCCVPLEKTRPEESDATDGRVQMGRGQQLSGCRHPGERQIHAIRLQRHSDSRGVHGEPRGNAVRGRQTEPDVRRAGGRSGAHHDRRRHVRPGRPPEYGDPKLWRPLAVYNSIDDPMRIANGTQVLLPNVEVLLG